MSALLWIGLFLTAAQELRMFPPGAPPADEIEVVDLRSATLDEKLAATTLQGLLNRGSRTSAYFLLAEWDGFWLERLREKQMIKRLQNVSFADFVARHAALPECIVSYDPDVPASVNVATMLAAVENGVAVHPDSAALFPGEKLRVDLRGRWKTNTEAYRWAFRELWPRMNQRILACYHPTACAHHLRDYLVTHEVFHFWVTSEEKSDGNVSNHGEERLFLEELLAAAPVNIPVLGFWYSGTDRGMDEYRGVGLAGEHGKLTVVCDWATNLSFLGGVPANLDAAMGAYRQRLKGDAPTLDIGKVYLCFDVVESGDSPSYLQGRQFQVWKDEKRGDAPINWSMGPAILELAPPIAAYYFEQATRSDYLYMAISGAAYVHPFRAFESRTTNPEAAWGEYANLTGYYMRRMQCGELGLYTDAWRPYERAAAEPVLKRFIEAIPEVEQVILGMGRGEGIAPDAASYEMGERPVLVSHVMTRWPEDYARRSHEENLAWLEADIRAHTPTQRPGFFQVMALSWAFNPGDIVDLSSRLGPEFVPVRLPDFLTLYREAAKRTQAD